MGMWMEEMAAMDARHAPNAQAGCTTKAVLYAVRPARRMGRGPLGQQWPPWAPGVSQFCWAVQQQPAAALHSRLPALPAA